MKEVLDRYIRSLAERELKGGAPEYRQDLGTFVGWLLDRLGFTVLLQAYKHEGLRRVKSAGRSQWGVDLVATKPDDDGVERTYLFVLKYGAFRRVDWQPTVRGSLVHDMWLAAGKVPHGRAGGERREVRVGGDRVTVVAVHNGDVDREDLDQLIDNELQTIEGRYGVGTDWWAAPQLLKLALDAIRGGPDGDGADRADAGLFPPAVQPFVRLALDSLVRVPDGFPYDVDAVDRLLDQALPVPANGTRKEPNGHPPLASSLQVWRVLAELSLFAEMVRVQSRRHADDLTFPTLDTLERILSRSMAAIAALSDKEVEKHRGDLAAALDVALGQYVAVAADLRERLAPLAGQPDSLALRAPGECIDYPLRTLRISGYLATAGLAALDRGAREEGERFADAVCELWKANPAGALHPVIDDQLIELAGAWELWLRLQLRDRVASSASALLQRFAWRRTMGFRLPATYQSARVPFPADGHPARLLVRAYYDQPGPPPPGFEDRSSTILPLAVWVSARLGVLDESLMAAFAPSVESEARGRGPLFPQAWQPPENAADEWYVRGIGTRGTAKVFRFREGLEKFAAEFDSFAKSLPQPPAERWGLRVIDRIAWKLWRTRPPLRMIISLVTSLTPSNT